MRRSSALGTGSAVGVTASRSATRSRAISSTLRSSVAAARALEARVERTDPLLHPVEQVLDRLEPLRQRAEPSRDPFHVRRGGNAERTHRGLLRVGGLLTSLERTLKRSRDHGIPEQILGQLAEGLLALLRKSIAQAFGLVAHAQQSSGRGARRALRGVPIWATLTLNLTLIWR